ncbi:MAG TPA: hypothetical protein VE862_07905 [Candidatus Acidoferrum sp.]|nr:hypothetical protein [Candidatus Acidoferrum sp.]
MKETTTGEATFQPKHQTATALSRHTEDVICASTTNSLASKRAKMVYQFTPEANLREAVGPENATLTNRTETSRKD